MRMQEEKEKLQLENKIKNLYLQREDQLIPEGQALKKDFQL